MLIYFLAQAPTASPAGGLNALSPFVMLGFFGVMMYYLMIRPQVKRQKEQARLISSLKTGDRVVTASGIHGMISNVKDATVILKVADNVKLEMEKSAVTSVAKSDT